MSLVEGADLPMRITSNKECPVAECPVDLVATCEWCFWIKWSCGVLNESGPEPLKGPFDSNGYAVGCRVNIINASSSVNR